jgi:hypothetical protein
MNEPPAARRHRSNPLNNLPLRCSPHGHGVTELVARYRDRPLAALSALSGLIYIVVNGAASGFALWLIRSVEDYLEDGCGTDRNVRFRDRQRE